jgi:hypothetical protein
MGLDRQGKSPNSLMGKSPAKDDLNGPLNDRQSEEPFALNISRMNVVAAAGSDESGAS